MYEKQLPPLQNTMKYSLNIIKCKSIFDFTTSAPQLGEPLLVWTTTAALGFGYCPGPGPRPVAGSLGLGARLQGPSPAANGSSLLTNRSSLPLFVHSYAHVKLQFASTTCCLKWWDYWFSSPFAGSAGFQCLPSTAYRVPPILELPRTASFLFERTAYRIFPCRLYRVPRRFAVALPRYRVPAVVLPRAP